ncbi:lipocalin-like domain-containing protein [Paucibacter sp. APW11]|uniref:Lipocalin-like domain-containing protein n=1 Tax=Roseateles aquae TaxID=3077235 RepID=A0ABU3P626_9BURK|nr:lipocalin-like domain-containing protein [Paucibacter sp. APW11]MDT8997665.1 lipocalin-like domain-containing protein [Paucibacter sp. APW11]
MAALPSRRLCLQALLAAAGTGLAPAAPALSRAALRFPRDHGSHPETAIEWWYLTGLLGEGSAADSAPLYGYQLTFFRIRQAWAETLDSAFAPRQLLLGHVALSDLRGRRQLHQQRLHRQGFAHARSSEADGVLRLGDWQLRRSDLAGSSTGSQLQAQFSLPQGRLALQLQTPAAPLLQGLDGWSQKGPSPEQASRYYSMPQLLTEAELQLDQRHLRLRGRSWLDHEWSDSLLGNADSASAERAVGWDWLGINLFDGSALTLFQLRRADGSRVWADGCLRRPDGAVQRFDRASIAMQPQRHWQSPSSRARYPVHWQLQTPAGSWQLEAWFEAQEIDARGSTGLLYWEGAARLSDASGRLLGHGYLEMTGYAGAMQIA